MKSLRLPLLILLLALSLSACQAEPEFPPTPTPTPPGGAVLAEAPTQAIVAAPPTETLVPTATPIPPSGPDSYPSGVNPLTGLTVSDPANLNRPPLYVKVSNYPEVVRPQSGVQQADHVWEHLTEGWALTRFSVVILGETPERVGSERSGRPIDFELVPMYEAIYSNSGSSTNNRQADQPLRMRELLFRAPWFNRNFSADFGYGEPYNVYIPREGIDQYHTLFNIPTEMWRLAAEKGIGPSTTLTPGLSFNATAPVGGTATDVFSIDYPGMGPLVEWRYDVAKNEWLRSTDGVPHGDALTGEQLHFDNVIIVFVPHSETDWLEDEAAQLYAVQVAFTGTGNAILLRDGQRYNITWRRDAVNRMVQFFDATGAMIPLKPGNTWFHPIPPTYDEFITFTP